jgi:biofilm PGA synthesis N-glycosyltransferase PgaC
VVEQRSDHGGIWSGGSGRDRSLVRQQPGGSGGDMTMVVIVPFLNEEQYLPGLLESISSQSRLPDLLVLVDDGSTDGSSAVAREFAARHPYARALQRPPRPPARDRLATASEWGAWRWALEQINVAGDLLVKLDADLRLTPRVFEVMELEFRADPRLGLAGARLSTVAHDGVVRPEHNADNHVRGATKFYRAECYREISPVPQILGWDVIDEVSARMHGWRTANVTVPGGDPVQRRMTGSYDGRLRGFRRHGVIAYGYGAHPLHVLLGGLRRATERPYVLGGASYVLGWVEGRVRRNPRAAPEIRAFARREQLERLRRRTTFSHGR